ncbi:MAG: hydrolase [Candidatus Abawacabacteria bacterium RBG_16_42_10]|uniref:Hydrolase n=1 Tax=Candidatus Abawacabacteria bacterium RBG_16_42_10 TaxID=1817814 RepID=A0A1F4XKA0_9BACT|nr:MAG: hydrolase [Candidatus Abawacabacteria bacterium RBG_16_42_10]
MKNFLVQIPIGGGKSLEGNLTVPDKAKGLVIFAHGSSSSRLSPRNVFVAEELNKADIATLLFDLLTEEEDSIYQTRFNIDLLTERLLTATDWIQQQESTKRFFIGYFGASTGAASALIAAANIGTDIKAVVSRGGRPDLAGKFLVNVESPTLLIVGGNDHEVIELNRAAYKKIPATKKLEIIPGATHLFEETGTLKEVAKLAAVWFKKYLH